jgi:anti-sigma regulatory factor (Ser/Thr protein kinase)
VAQHDLPPGWVVLTVHGSPCGETVIVQVRRGVVREDRSAVLPRLPSSARQARQLVLAVLQDAGRQGDAHAGIAELLVSELATNAIRYGSGDDFGLRVRVSGAVLRVAVHDRNPVVPQPRHSAPAEEGGRGMQLVEALASDWGTDAGADGKTVWFDLRAEG